MRASWQLWARDDVARDLKVSQWLPAAALTTAALLGPTKPILPPVNAFPSEDALVLVKENRISSAPELSAFNLERATTAKTMLSMQTPRTGPVMDLARVLSTEEHLAILTSIQQAQDRTGTEIQVILVDQIDPVKRSPKQMATDLFNQWKIGPAGKNNGVLILAVLDQHRVEIEVGSGIDTWMSADWCTRTLQETAVPQCRQGQYGKGILQTVDRVAKRLADDPHPHGQSHNVAERTAEAQPTASSSSDSVSSYRPVFLSLISIALVLSRDTASSSWKRRGAGQQPLEEKTEEDEAEIKRAAAILRARYLAENRQVKPIKKLKKSKTKRRGINSKKSSGYRPRSGGNKSTGTGTSSSSSSSYYDDSSNWSSSSGTSDCGGGSSDDGGGSSDDGGGSSDGGGGGADW
ncbi:Pfam:DUF477 [Seminavis robusta]|uniref:Pfam:DUF477 n=1 Tax=Seminavis robusta TaxID=568900 RepID=A0A9N8H7B1_9STRA|nr:Pfam:DUF477 [Seminavis robusta]|eukprot:Sro64_g036390.1 Pfam:DUF477 (406) ;mRNA; f:100914-102131